MTAHIFNSKLDPSLPATLSVRVIEGLLRGELRFDGVVISDDMQMKAISARYGLEDAVLLAIGAGVDILTFANNSVFDPDIAASAIGIIRKAVQGGRITTGKDRPVLCPYPATENAVGQKRNLKHAVLPFPFEGQLV